VRLRGYVALCSTLLWATPSAHAEDHHHHHHHHHHHKDKTTDAPEVTPPVPEEAANPTPPEPLPVPLPPPVKPKASAQNDLGAQADRPWAKNVSPAEQQTADALFHEGNNLLKESLFVHAAEKYREALRHWKHPGIHYNLALALLNLDQPIEVFLNLEAAMKYGPGPLEQDKYEHAERYRKLIEKQIARVTVTCEHPGAVVSLDGRPIFTAPGQYVGLVRTGQHTFLAEKPGFVNAQKAPVFSPGEQATIDLKLFTVEQMTEYRRRWHAAVPWSVLAAGVVVAGIGGIMHWQTSVKYHDYDNQITDCARAGGGFGCMPTGAISGSKSTGDGLQAGAFTAYAVGGGIFVAGAVLAVLNRAKPVQVQRDRQVSVQPSYGKGGASLSASFRF
jgi:hypothetical protein